MDKPLRVAVKPKNLPKNAREPLYNGSHVRERAETKETVRWLGG